MLLLVLALAYQEGLFFGKSCGAQSAREEEEEEEVIVAAAALMPGTSLENANLTVESRPKRLVPQAAIKSFDEVRGLYVASLIPAGFPLVKDLLSDQPDAKTSIQPPNCWQVADEKVEQ
jgi:Flp pilus assembly protein CpaB